MQLNIRKRQSQAEKEVKRSQSRKRQIISIKYKAANKTPQKVKTTGLNYFI